ncbi:MAG: DUF1348 family protein [Gordonia sp. (in: high G+C Gram-positive bacteria)]
MASSTVPRSDSRCSSVSAAGIGSLPRYCERSFFRVASLRKERSFFTYGNRIAVRFQYEWRDDVDQWWRSYGNELWEFADSGLMSRREASINDVAITQSERRIFGPRTVDERGRDFPLR